LYGAITRKSAGQVKPVKNSQVNKDLSRSQHVATGSLKAKVTNKTMITLHSVKRI